jgi:hypothetical protein
MIETIAETKNAISVNQIEVILSIKTKVNGGISAEIRQINIAILSMRSLYTTGFPAFCLWSISEMPRTLILNKKLET